MLHRNAKGWLGTLPSKMLETLVRPEVAYNGPQLDCQLQTNGMCWKCSGSLTFVGDDTPLNAAVENCPSDETAREEVALQLLHQYQTRFLQLFPACGASS